MVSLANLVATNFLALLARFFPSSAIALTSAALLAPSLILGTLPSHDSPYIVAWASQFAEQFRAGILYPRWLPDSFEGLGGPAFYFYPPLAYWLDGLVSVVTLGELSVLWRLPVVFLLLLWLSGWAMYAWLRAEQLDARVALYGSLGYMAAPYHLLDHYARGALAESAAYTFLPLVILGIRHVADPRRRFGFFLLALSYAALLLSHLPTALLISVTAAPAYALFSAWRLGGKAGIFSLVRCALAATLGAGIAATYLLPALDLQPAISSEQLWTDFYSVQTWFLLTPWRWIGPRWMMLAISASALSWGLASAAVLLARGDGALATARRLASLFWAWLCLAVIVLMSGLLPWFWSVVPFVAKVQFPWRLMIVADFSVITALCLADWSVRHRLAQLLLIAAVVVAVPTAAMMGKITKANIAGQLAGRIEPPRDAKEYRPAGYPQREDAAYNDLGLEPTRALPIISCTPAAVVCRAEARRFGALGIDLEVGEPTTVVVRRFFFPAWQLSPFLPLAPSEPLKLVSFTATAGHTSAVLDRASLPVERRGWLLSALSLALLALWVGAIFYREERFAKAE